MGLFGTKIFSLNLGVQSNKKHDIIYKSPSHDKRCLIYTFQWGKDCPQGIDARLGLLCFKLKRYKTFCVVKMNFVCWKNSLLINF